MNHHILNNLTIIPYHGEKAEYAWQVRKVVSGLRSEDLVIAVDLPEGYEERVLRAVKDLPRVSLLIDPLKRGIPIIPTHPGVEAVRSFLEWGLDLIFVDTSLPLCGTPEEVDHFLESVRTHGIDAVIEKAENFGIDINRIIGLTGPSAPDIKVPPFSDSPTISAAVPSLEIYKVSAAYLDARHRYMASRLLGPLREGRPVVFVCHAMHEAGVRAYLEQGVVVPATSVFIPTNRCRVRESDIPLITTEIPFCMYLYELYRNLEPDRRAWIERICTEATEKDSVATIETLIRYAENLALSDGLGSPDLYTLICASAACAPPEYTLRFLNVARSYPPADRQSNCVIVPHYDPNFQPQGAGRSVELARTLERVRRQAAIRSKPQRSSSATTFDRTADSLRHERDFIRYLTSRYLSLQPSGERAPAPFTSGIRDGIDIRQTLRNHWSGEIYVQEEEMTNDAGYVFYFGGTPNWQVYFDKQHSMVGTARRDGNTFTMVSLVAFTRELPARTIMNEIRVWEPLQSAIEVALRYCQHVFLFSERRPDPATPAHAGGRVQWIPLASLPNTIQQKIQVYHVV